MNKQGEPRFLTIQEAAEFLQCNEDELLKLIENKQVPHSVLPFGKILFYPERLREWALSYEQMPEYKKHKGSAYETEKVSFTEQICRKFGCVAKKRDRYINIYKEQKVYAQLHPRRTVDGIDLALRECGDDINLPPCNILKKNDIRELNGYWKANKNWLEGDGRFTEHPAAAFHIPIELQNEPQNKGWKELEQLLKYAYDK